MNPTTLAEINAFDYWHRSDLAREAIARMLGQAHLEFVLNRGAGYCDGRAAGAWQANDKETYCAYRSLAALIRAGAL